MAEPDYIYYVGDTLPAFELTLKRRTSVFDLTNMSASVYFRPSGGNNNVISGSAAIVVATAGTIRFLISSAASGSAGFPSPGAYVGQVVLSATSGIQSSRPLYVRVENSYRVV